MWKRALDEMEKGIKLKEEGNGKLRSILAKIRGDQRELKDFLIQNKGMSERIDPVLGKGVYCVRKV